LTLDEAIIIEVFVIVQCFLDAHGKSIVKAMVMVCLHHVVVENAILWGISGLASSFCLQVCYSFRNLCLLGAIELPAFLLGLAHAHSLTVLSVAVGVVVAVPALWVLCHRFNVNP